MQARMRNPALVVPGAMKGLLDVIKAVRAVGVPAHTLNLVMIRASQINGCSYCVYSHNREAKHAGETEERRWAVAAWRESPHFDAAERAALELTEYATRVADRTGQQVPDDVYARAAKHFDEQQLSAIILTIGVINLFNRLMIVAAIPAGTVMA
jgi:AhpD family alkylhydroperoxidase